MRDQYRTLMLASLKDAMEIVKEYNEWTKAEFGDEMAVPPQAVPQLALMLYQARVQESFSESGSLNVPEFDDKMYE